MKWIKASERLPETKGFYSVRGLNNQGNPVTHEDKDPIWFTGERWIIREGCEVTEWLSTEGEDAQSEQVSYQVKLKDLALGVQTWAVIWDNATTMHLREFVDKMNASFTITRKP